MPVIERGNQADMFGQQHPVAEHVARHVADARHREIRCLRVVVDLAKVALDAFPRPFRRDSHFLVVVTCRATRGKGIVEPMAVLDANGVRVVGERRRTLVGRHHQIRVIRVMPDHVPGRHDLAFVEIVGNIEQAPQKNLVTGNAFSHQRLAIAGGRCGLQHESALRTHRHDHGVLDHLCFHQAQYFGPVIFGTIRPAQAAASNFAAAKVNPLDAR